MMDQASEPPSWVDEPVESQLARHITAVAAQTHLLGLVSGIMLNRLEAEGTVRTEDVRAIHDTIQTLRKELMPQMLPADQMRFEDFAARFES
jgi:hypothetical protein